MWAFFGLLIVLNVVFVLWLLWFYKAPTAPISSLLVTFYAWVISVWIVALVPLDVTATLQLQHDGETSQAALTAIGVMWLVSYWSTQILTWLLIPIFMVYVDAGDFTVLGKLSTSVKENLVFYGLMIVLGIIGIMLILFTGRLRLSDMFSSFPSLAATLSNTFGLVVCIVLMGYGLVEIPKTLWQRANPKQMVRYAHHKVGRLADQLEDASFEIERCMKAVDVTRSQIPVRDPLFPYMQRITNYAHKNSPIVPGSLSVDIDSVPPDDLQFGDDQDTLAKLMRRVRRSIYTYKSAYQAYKDTVLYAFRLEHMIKCQQTHVYVVPEGYSQRKLAAFYWRYACTAQPHLMRLLALFLAGLSVLVVWSEITIGSGRDPNLSPFSKLLLSTKNEVAINIITLIPLLYICICSYFSLFQLAMFDFYRLVPGYTNPYCMLLNATLLCRFTAPLAFNVLHVLRMNDQKTVFSEKMGSVTENSILGTGFNTWFPITTLLVCFLMLMNAYNQFLMKCIPARFRFSIDDTDDDYTSRGQRIVERERNSVARGHVIGQAIGFVAGIDQEKGELSRRGETARAKRGGTGSSSDELQVLDVNRQHGYSSSYNNSSSYQPPVQAMQTANGSEGGGMWSKFVQNTQNAGQNFFGRFRRGGDNDSQPPARSVRSQPRPPNPRSGNNLDDIFQGLSMQNNNNNNRRIDDADSAYVPRGHYSSY
eukprot:TRINITY_DN8278_c0_g1_i1.p1 TRINITY_DN8278_c0_g1~~TRINITY_DN8278_c0_g1_i1.p1  ORF type:complete len:705 (+),score=48.23 TRINITY_DN8278_c0_g1_i1:276-2390(+)